MQLKGLIPKFSLVLLAAIACKSPQPVSQTPPAPAAANATVILREASYEDSDLAARNRGRLEVVVRSTNRPTQVLNEARVLVRVGTRDVGAYTDQQDWLDSIRSRLVST